MIGKTSNDWAAMGDNVIIRTIGEYIKHYRLEQRNLGTPLPGRPHLLTVAT